MALLSWDLWSELCRVRVFGYRMRWLGRPLNSIVLCDAGVKWSWSMGPFFYGTLVLFGWNRKRVVKNLDMLLPFVVWMVWVYVEEGREWGHFCGKDGR